MTDASKDLEFAKTIVDQLSPLDRDSQERILRWVAESLGITLHVKHAPHSSPAFMPSQQSSTQYAESADGIGTQHEGGTDIRQFVQEKEPRSDVHFATVVAYYYRFKAPVSERSEFITGVMLQEAARQSGRNRLHQPVVTLNNAKKQGYLNAGGRGRFVVNTVGENLVAMTLPGTSEPTERSNRRRATKTKTRPRARKKAKAKAKRKGR